MSIHYLLISESRSLAFLFQNKKERKKVREVGILKKDPETLKEQIEKLEMMSKSLSLHVLLIP